MKYYYNSSKNKATFQKVLNTKITLQKCATLNSSHCDKSRYFVKKKRKKIHPLTF